LRQFEQRIAAAVGVVQAFQRGRGRTEHNRQVLLARTQQGQIAGVVAQAFLLFIRGVVLLVDDDQAGILHRREQGRTGTDDDVRLAIAGGEPGIESFTIVDVGVQQRDPGVEALFEAGERLWPQVDLGDQHQRLLAGFQYSMNQLQVDLGLAAAGHPRQQERLKSSEPRAHRLEGRALLCIQGELGL